MIGEWRPQIGDPTIVGWVTVLAYFATSFLCWRAAMGERRVARRAHRQFWQMTALALAGLGLNKQLDLQSALIAITRHAALQSGWYDSRGYYQIMFLELVAVAVLVGTGFLIWRFRGGGPVRMAIVGAVLLCGFVIGRAASFHEADALLAQRLGDWRVNWVVELSGIATVGLAAAWQNGLNARARLWHRRGARQDHVERATLD